MFAHITAAYLSCHMQKYVLITLLEFDKEQNDSHGIWMKITQWFMNGFPDSEFWNSTLRWRHNGRDSVSNHQPHGCLLKGLFRRRSRKTSKLRVTDLCVGNSPGNGEFPAQMTSNAENVPIWWRHHGYITSRTIGRIFRIIIKKNKWIECSIEMHWAWIIYMCILAYPIRKRQKW